MHRIHHINDNTVSSCELGVEVSGIDCFLTTIQRKRFFSDEVHTFRLNQQQMLDLASDLICAAKRMPKHEISDLDIISRLCDKLRSKVLEE